MPYESDILDAHFATILPGRNLPAVSRNVRGYTASSATSQKTDSLKWPTNSSITTESLDKSKLHDESILSFTAQGSEVTSPSRRKTKSVSKARTELKPKSGYFTQLSENSVASKKTAYNFEPYTKSISPLNEFPKLVFESAQCKTSLITSSLESTNDSNSHSKFILPCKESHKFQFECSQPKTSSKTSTSGSVNDSNSHSKFTSPFNKSHKLFEFSQTKTSSNTTFSGSANNSNSHSAFNLPFEESHKLFEFSQPKTSSKISTSGSVNDSNSHSKFTLPFNKSHKLFEFSQPKTSSNTTISGSANDSNSHSKFTLPFKEPHKFQFEPKTSSNATISGSANDSNSHSKFTLPVKDSHKLLAFSQPKPSSNTTISDSANYSNSHSKLFSLPFKESHKFQFEYSQMKTSSDTNISENESSLKPCSKSILPFNKLQKFKFECCQPIPSLNKTISESSNDSKSYGKTIIPCKKPQNFERSQPKTNFDSNISESASDCKSDYTSSLPFNTFLEFKLEIPKTNLTKKNIPNILYFENLLFEKYVSTYFETDNLFSSLNSRSKILNKVIEINKGKRFVRMERSVNCNKCTKTPALQQNLSYTCIPDIVDSKYSKNSLITEYGNVLKSNRYITSNVCEDKDEFPDDTQQYNRNISKLVSNSKVAPIQAYHQLCLVLKDSPVSYILESASKEFGQESEYVFDLPISYPAIDDDLKNPDEIVKAGNEEEKLNKEAFANGVPVPADDIHQPIDNIFQSLDDALVSSADTFYESDDDVCQVIKSIYGNIHYLKKVLDDVEKNSELIGKELGLPPVCISDIVTGCSTVPKKNFNPSDFINTYGNKPFKIENHKKYESSLAIRYFKNERQNTVSPITNFSKESVQEKSSMLPFETNLLLIDSILLRLQNTYQSIQREISSWSTVHDTDSTGTKFKNGNLSTTEDDCLAKALKCLMKFKDRRGSTSVKGIGRRFSDSGSSFSLTNDEIRRRTGKVSSAEKKCSFLEKGINTRSSIAKHYESVWILSSSDSDEVDGPVDNEISNDTEKISAAEKDSLSKNSKCILKFRGRHASASRGKYNDFDSSSSDSDKMTGQSENESSNQSERKSPVEMCSFSNKGGHTEISEGSYYDCVKISSYSGELNDHTDDKMDESEVDDSESSLEGSFKNFRTSSRLLSPISSGDDSDDSSADDVPRFSLPPPKIHAKKFYSKKTEFLEQVSCKEWSLKKGETEISFKCTQRGRRFRSDERCTRDSQGIPEELWQDDLGIPSDLLQDSSQFATIK